LPGKGAAGDQRVDVRMPVQQFTVGLDRGDHAGQNKGVGVRRRKPEESSE
jgi:hypothetical protein